VGLPWTNVVYPYQWYHFIIIVPIRADMELGINGLIFARAWIFVSVVWYGVGVDKGSDMGYCGQLKGCPNHSWYLNINVP